MKAKTIQIIWHSSQPVLSLDFHVPTSLLATGGADNDIKLWSLSQQDPRVFFEANLSYHSAAVNVVRFSPSGQELASGADGGELLLWRPVQSNDNTPLWKVIKTLRFHPKDVLDLEWSPDGSLLASGSVDNSCIIWDIMKGIPLQILTDHLHYVQGVAWDPTGQYLASISCDRTCRIYSCKSASSKSKGQERKTFTCQHILVKTEAGALDTTEKLIDDGSMAKAAPLKYHLFHDENMPSFFRRLAWSPDGSFLLIPAGIYKHTAEANSLNTAYILSRKDLSRPSLQLPGASKPIVAVRFCPLLFKHVSPSEAVNEGEKIFKLPYRLVFAVATLNSVLIYDTHQLSPVAVLAGIHYAAITDLAWSPDGKHLVVSSQDGFCTLVEFEDGDLGQIMPLSDAPHQVAEHMPACWLSKAGVCVDENVQKCSEGYEAGIEANSNSHLFPSNVDIDMGKNVHTNDGLVSSIGSAEQHTPEQEKSSFAGHHAPSQNESCMEKIRPLSGQKRRIVPVPIPPELQTERNL